MNNLLTIVKTQIGIYAGIVDKTMSDHNVELNDPVAFEVMMMPSEGAIKGSVTFNPQWICYNLWTSKIEINLSGAYLIYVISLVEDNFIGNIYKKAMAQQNKSPLTKLH